MDRSRRRVALRAAVALVVLAAGGCMPDVGSDPLPAAMEFDPGAASARIPEPTLPAEATSGRVGPEGTYRTLGHFVAVTLSVVIDGPRASGDAGGRERPGDEAPSARTHGTSDALSIVPFSTAEPG